MAKTKVKVKKKAENESLTQDEILASALVPEEEQPYKIPDNWVWVKVSELVDLYRGVSYSKDAAHNDKLDNDCLIMRGGNIEEGTINFFDNIYINANFVNPNQLIRRNDIIIVSSTGSSKVIGKAGISDDDYSDVAFGAFLTLVRPRNVFCKRLIALFFQTEEYRNSIRSLAKGVNINNIKNEYILNIPFPLPPLDEQERIVKRIENLFKKLDYAKELAQNALDSFETRKAAILHKAFSGELTAKWRKENGVKFESWEEKVLGNILLSMNVRKPKGNSFRYIDIDSINNDIQEVKAPKELLTKNAPSRASREVQEGNTLFSMVRPYLKNIAYIDKTLSDCIASTGFYVCRPSSQINPIFLYRFLTNDEVIMKINSYMKGDNSPSVRAEDIENTEILLPSLPEQKEIVRILDCLFEKEKRARELCGVIGKIDLMKKAILARAFRGELGTGELN